MKLTIGSIKGGVGKSLLSTNLAVIRSSMGRKVLLVDADEQGTSSDWVDHRINLGVTTNWTTIRLKGNSVRSEIQKLSKEYDDIICDVGGRDTASLRAALVVSDTLLVPFQAKSFDIWTAEKVADLVDEAKSFNDHLRAFSVINCAASRGSDNKDAEGILSQLKSIKLLSSTIGLRKAFSNATAEGLGVIELNSDPKAIQEIKKLHDLLYKNI